MVSASVRASQQSVGLELAGAGRFRPVHSGNCGVICPGHFDRIEVYNYKLFQGDA